MPKQNKVVNTPTVVCIVADISADKLGGAEMHFVEVAKRLTPSFNLILITGADTSIGKFIPQAKVLPISYPKIPNFFGLCFILWGWWQLRSKFKDQQVDLLWAKQCYPQAPLAALLKRKLQVPLYITAQNPMLHKEELVLKGSTINLFKGVLTDFLTPLISWSLRESDIVAAVSNYSAKLAKTMGAKKVEVIPNGVDIETFASKNRRSKNNEPLKILTTSALIPRNGVDILVSAVALLPKTLSWELTIAGDGPERANLESLVTALNLNQQIIFLGRIKNIDIPKLLHQADVFIRPSRWEGFGVSFVEAMAARVPVIATPVGGITDFLIDKQTGLLAQVENPQSVADNILWLTKHDQKVNQIVNSAETLVQLKYTWDNITNQVTKSFKKLLQTNGD